jgi:hypothetical protein
MINTNSLTKSNLDNNSSCFISWYNVVERQQKKKMSINVIKTFILTGKTIKYKVLVYDENHPLYKFNGRIMKKEDILINLLDVLENGAFNSYFNQKYPIFKTHLHENHLENIQSLMNYDIGKAILMYLIMTNYYNGLLYCYMERQ